MRFSKLTFVIILFLSFVVESQDTMQGKNEIILLLQDHLTPADYALIEANIEVLSIDQLQEIYTFMTDSQIIANSDWFDVSNYGNWNEYNFSRRTDEQIMTLLGRRDLFYDPARQLNNRLLTNMSDEALASLTFSQVYVEETWDQEPPWDGDPNTQFNWIHPDLLQDKSINQFLSGGFIYKERVGYWYATYWSALLALLHYFDIGDGTDEQLILKQLEFQAPRLAGYAYPVGNQLYLGTAETVYWFTDYLDIGHERYDELTIHDWDTKIEFQFPTHNIVSVENDDVLQQVLDAPFARELRIELTNPEIASFWNTMRYVHAAARQREGGASEDHPENGQPNLLALRYYERTSEPVGRSTSDVSAFAILTTVYSDSLLLDFTNWNTNQNSLVLVPANPNRSDGLHRMVSERNKAILVIEHMADEYIYPNATHITGSRGLGFQLITQFDDSETGDFLPYTPEESYALTMALIVEARDYQLEASLATLCNSPLLKKGYETYREIELSAINWSDLVGNLCDV